MEFEEEVFEFADESIEKQEEIKDEELQQEQQEDSQQEEQQEVELQEEVVDFKSEAEKYRQELEEYKRKYEEVSSKTEENPFANEEIKKLNELAKNGVEINEDFWKWQRLDLDKFDVKSKDHALELRRMELALQNPELESHEVERLLKRSYKVLFSDYDEGDDEYQEALTDLSIDAKKSRTAIKAYKDKIQLPKVDLSKREEEQRLNKEARDRFLQDVKTNVSSFDGFEIDLGETKLKYSVDDKETKEYLESSIVNDTSFLRDNYVKDGKVDYNSLQRDLSLIANKDKIFKIIFEQGVSRGKEQIVKEELENATDTRSEGRKSESIDDAWLSIAKQLR